MSDVGFQRAESREQKVVLSAKSWRLEFGS